MPLLLTSHFMELTKEYLDRALKNLATKEDLKGLAKETSVDAIRSFIDEHMPTKDEQKEFATKAYIQAETNKVLSAVDAMAQQTKTDTEEKSALTDQLKNMKDWILEAAEKIGVEYKG